MEGSYGAKKAAIRKHPSLSGGPFRLEKSTVSNLFRYESGGTPARRLPLGHFNKVIGLDEAAQTLDVEGLTTFDTIVARCLLQGFLPLVTPELKHITIGGATVGIGIESTGFRHGFVHDALIEADVLLPGGEVLTCTRDNEHADLFHGLPNSYGTLGYILRARIALQRAQPFVHLTIRCLETPAAYLDAMRDATTRADIDFIEGLFFEDHRFYLMTGRFADSVPHLDNILRDHVFYKLVQARGDIYLTTTDYIFRYDPEWFWNIPDTGAFRLFRRFAPKRLRNSGFYVKYATWKKHIRRLLPGRAPVDSEPLIQDWEVPWEKAGELIEFCLNEVSLDGLPWAVVPIRSGKQPALYPIRPDRLYFNLGCYCQVHRPGNREPYYLTKIMDRKCFDLGGIKMLYSSTFLSRTEFDARYNGDAYRKLKEKYDPRGIMPTLYQKVAYLGSAYLGSE